MTVQHVGFATAASGVASNAADWLPAPLDDGFASAYAEAADRVLAAFAAAAAADGTLQQRVLLPEISTTVTFPAAQAISFHFIDYVVHSWDVARSADLPMAFAPDVLDAALTVAEAVPQGESRLRAGAAFGPVVEVPADAPALDRIVAVLGRSPS